MKQNFASIQSKYDTVLIVLLLLLFIIVFIFINAFVIHKPQMHCENSCYYKRHLQQDMSSYLCEIGYFLEFMGVFHFRDIS